MGVQIALAPSHLYCFCFLRHGDSNRKKCVPAKGIRAIVFD